MKALITLTTVFLMVFILHGCNLLSAAGIGSQGQPIKKVESEMAAIQSASAMDIDHSQWDRLLKKYVDRNGLIDYKGFKNDREELDAYLKMLSQKKPDQDWSLQELLAYYINLYNAATVRLIVENYPINSIKDIDGAWTKGRVRVGKRKLSLGGIENGILRKMNEPRIHFAINCASISCPKLMDEAFTASKINVQLNRAAKEFINGDKNDIKPDKLTLSSIFHWYQKDFTVNGKQNIIGYINLFSRVKINPQATISYKEYNWHLNEQK